MSIRKYDFHRHLSDSAGHFDDSDFSGNTDLSVSADLSGDADISSNADRSGDTPFWRARPF